VRCSALQGVAVFDSALQCVVVCYSALQCLAVCYSASQCVAMRGSVVLHLCASMYLSCV